MHNSTDLISANFDIMAGDLSKLNELFHDVYLYHLRYHVSSRDGGIKEMLKKIHLRLIIVEGKSKK